MWVCVLGFGFRLRPATPGWGVGVCVYLCAPSFVPRHSCLGLWCVSLVLRGTYSCAVVRCMLCALPGFAAPGGRFRLALVRVPWLWPAACLSGVPGGPAWCGAPRLVRSLSVLRLAFPTPWSLSPPRGLAPPAFLGGCAGHADAGREPGSLCLPLAPTEAGAPGSLRVVPLRGLAMGLSLVGPSGVGLGLVCCGGVRVWTRSLTRSVSRTVRLPTGDSAGAPGLVGVAADTAPFGSGDVTPGSRACVRVRAFFAGSCGPASRARFGAPHLFLWPFLVLLSARPPPGWGCPACGCSCVFCFFFPFLFFLRPPCLLCFVFSGPGCPEPSRCAPPPPLSCFYSPPFSFSPPFRVFFSCRLLFFFFLLPLLFFLLFRGVPVVRCSVLLWGVLVCVVVGLVLRRGVAVRLRSFVRCSLPVPPPFVLLRVVLRVPGGAVLTALLFPVLPLVGAVWCCPAPFPSGVLRGFLFFFRLSGLCWLCPLLPPRLVVVSCCALSCVVSCGDAVCGVFCVVPGVVWRACVWLGSCAVLFGAVLCWVLFLLCFAVVRRCVLCWFFFALSLAFPWCSGLLLFLCPACAVLCWCACVVALCAVLPCPCCAGWCVVACCVCVFAVGRRCPLLSPGGSWWLVVSCFGGVLCCVPGCCAAPCCCALCRLALCCCALCCFVLLCLVLSRAVSFPGALFAVLGSCAFRRCVLSCLPALGVFCCGVLLRGAVRRCAMCRVRPSVSCCAFPVLPALCGAAVRPCSPLVPCSPVLCPVVPWCRVVLWCRVLLPCLVCFLCLFGFSYLKSRCKIC